MNCIEVKNVSKRYGSTSALDNVSLRFDAGKIYGLLGRNGAGKTTLLNAITGRIFADSGQLLADGATTTENDDSLRKIYMLSEKNYYPERMRVAEAFRNTALFYPRFNLGYAMDLAGKFNLDTKKRVGALSTGYCTIFKLITALSTNAPYLLLDEPVLGLDANHRDLFYKTLIEKYAENPCCIVLSTHLVEEVSALVEDIVIIKNGQVLKNESRDNILAAGYTVTGSAAAVDAFTQGKTLLGSDAVGGLKSAYLMGERPATLPEGLEVSSMDLQRLFIQLTND